MNSTGEIYCGRCGREGHESKICTEKYDIRSCKLEMYCIRCGRDEHTHKSCDARYDANRKYIGDNPNYFNTDDLEKYHTRIGKRIGTDYKYKQISYDDGKVSEYEGTYSYYNNRKYLDIAGGMLPDEKLLVFYEKNDNATHELETVIAITTSHIRVYKNGDDDCIIKISNIVQVKHVKKMILFDDNIIFSLRDGKSVKIAVPYTKIAEYIVNMLEHPIDN